MREVLRKTLTIACFFGIISSGAWAQTDQLDADDEFTLEEVTVTAEKREGKLQNVPASVTAISGESFIELGKISMPQRLEGIPNVRATGSDANSITIRGLRAHFATPGSGRVPSSTALYVDEVYDGIGGDYDVGRMEVLRGPQGTLYGRSALGGVVATYTNDPKLNEYSGSITAETGTAKLQNYQGALNIPLGSKFAMRVAGQLNKQGEGYYNKEGGASENRAGRVKFLYQPSDELQIILTGNYSDAKSQTGGTSATLDGPDEINYSGYVEDVEWDALSKSTQGTLEANYDFPTSSLTYIGSYKVDETEENESTGFQRTQLQYQTGGVPGSDTHTQELRWASNEEGWWTWLLGSSYYSYDYGTYSDVWIVKSYMDGSRTVPNPDPLSENAYSHGADRTGTIEQWGLFTEETFTLTDKLQITAGLRYDRTTVKGHEVATMNMNFNEFGQEMRPEDIEVFQVIDTLKYNNFTWKLRVEYYMAPENLLYASASTGFLPGDVRINSKFLVEFFPSFKILGIEFTGMPMDEEKVIAYEVGSKNQFLDNRLHVNGALFYYDYDEFRNPVNTSPFQMPTWATIATPLRMIGAEIDVSWLITKKDKVSFSAGYLDAKITDFPIHPFHGDTREYLVFDRIENNPEWLLNCSYDHAFIFADGSTMVPRISARWQSGMHLENLTQQQYDIGYEPYVWQDSYMIADLGITWVSSSNRYTVSGYIRNLADKEYKNAIGSMGTADTLGTGVTVGDPRTWGVNLTINF